MSEGKHRKADGPARWPVSDPDKRTGQSKHEKKEGAVQEKGLCDKCGGIGVVNGQVCSKCNGTGNG